MPGLNLAVLGHRVAVECAQAGILDVVGRVYGSFLVPSGTGVASLAYRIDGETAGGPPFRLQRAGFALAEALDLGELLFHLDQDITVSLQRLRADLFFVHAGCLQLGGAASRPPDPPPLRRSEFASAAPPVASEAAAPRAAGAALLVGESGAGKSTMAWALLHEGLGFLGDELAPVDLASLEVQPFPRALCLKREPPGPYPVPEAAIRTTRTMYVTNDLLPAPTIVEPRRLAAVVFVGFSREPAVLRRVSVAEATARLYASTLNALAHADSGLPAAERIARGAECLALTGGPLPDQVQLLVEAFLPRRPAEEDVKGERARKAALRSGRSR